MSTHSEITGLLAGVRRGDASAERELPKLVYGELRRLAKGCLWRERPDNTLQPTALVHEAYLRIMRQGNLTFHFRAHFFAAAAMAMRRILIDQARKHEAAKRPGRDRVELNEFLASTAPRFDQLLIIDEALTRLAGWDPRQARVVELLYFRGLTELEVSAAPGISERTVKRDWAAARAWLQTQLVGSRA